MFNGWQLNRQIIKSVTYTPKKKKPKPNQTHNFSATQTRVCHCACASQKRVVLVCKQTAARWCAGRSCGHGRKQRQRNHRASWRRRDGENEQAETWLAIVYGERHGFRERRIQQHSVLTPPAGVQWCSHLHHRHCHGTTSHHATIYEDQLSVMFVTQPVDLSLHFCLCRYYLLPIPNFRTMR